MLGGVHGRNEAKVYAELCHAVDEWIKIHKKDREPLPEATANKSFSGKFILRTGEELHKTLAITALRKGESLNNFCIKTLKEKVA